MTDNPPGSSPTNPSAIVLEEYVAIMREVAAAVSMHLPTPFQREAFEILARLALQSSPPSEVPPPARGPSVAQATGRAFGVDSAHLELEPYGSLLAGPGRTLLKALAALEIAADQLGIDWLSPAEIERLLSERARVRSVYRTNISNALRGARQLADRRRRGRGYEYHITLRGREALERERSILGS